MKPLYRRLLIGLGFIVLIVVARFSGVGSYINLAYIRENSEYLQKLVKDRYGFSVAFFLITYIITVLFSIPVTPALNVAGGYFFGIIPGALYSICGATIGATLSFFMFRYLLRNFVQDRYGARLKVFNQEFEKRGVSYLLFMQLLPITPFGIITVISGLSHISWWTFVWTTALGITPGLFIYAFAGQQLMTIQKSSDILSWPIVFSLVLLALISSLPVLMRHLQKRGSFSR